MKEDSVSQWERLRSMSRNVGPCTLVRMGFHKTIRPAVTQWRRIGAQLGKTQLDGAALARALRVKQRALLQTVPEIRRAMAMRLPSGPADAEAIASCLKKKAPEVLSAITKEADRICGHTFNLLGSGEIKLGPQIDWHSDFKSGYRWDPQLFCADVPHGHLPGVDIKVPWELSRCQHLPLLAQAYLLTKDERYPREIVAQLRDWLLQNPPSYGVNWASPMEVAIRVVNWLWAVGLASDSPEITKEFFSDFLAGVLAHGRYLMNNLEMRTDGITTNHYLANLVGVLYLGLCLPELAESEGWQTFSVHAITLEMERQVLPDGVHYESSISYHRLVTEMFLSAAVLCRNNGIHLSPAFWDRLALMVEFVHAYTKPNGLAPQIGDEDDGRLHILSGYGVADPRDHRHLLALGAFLYERDDWWAAAGPCWHEALWYGAERTPRWSHPAPTSINHGDTAAFPNAGLYIMRSQDDYVLINCGPVGTRGVGSHKHNDLLAIEVHLAGEDIIIDSGSFLYTSNSEAYNSSRSTAAHSTVTIDGVEQNRFLPNKPFVLHPDACPQVLVWKTDDVCTVVVAAHNGYTRLKDPIVHRRAVTFTQSTGQVEVLDHFFDPLHSSAEHELIWTFPFAPGCVVEPDKDGWEINTAHQHVRLSAPYCELLAETLSIDSKVEQGWVSPRYGVREQAPILRWRWKGPIPITVRFTLNRN